MKLTHKAMLSCRGDLWSPSSISAHSVMRKVWNQTIIL